MSEHRILQGDVLERLRELPDKSVDSAFTSPPYWALRSYLKKDDPLKSLEIGSESTPELWLAKMWEVFGEVRRVLKDEGTLWVNLGDTYGGGNTDNRTGVCQDGGDGAFARLHSNNASGLVDTQVHRQSVLPKCLLMLPERFAWGMVERGWVLRNKIVWYKRNAMPCSAKDRFGCKWEYLFMFAKSNQTQFWTNERTCRLVSKPPLGTHGVEGEDWEWVTNLDGKPAKRNLWSGHDYWFDLTAVRQPHKDASFERVKSGRITSKYEGDASCQTLGHADADPSTWLHPAGANPGDVLSIPSQPRSETKQYRGKPGYVEVGGTIRKVSPDCPVHGLPRESYRTDMVSCDGHEVCGLTRHSPDNTNCLYPEHHDGSTSKYHPDHQQSSREDDLGSNRYDIGSRRTSESSRGKATEVQTDHGTVDTQQEGDPCMPGCSSPSDVPSATGHSRRSHRKAPGVSTSPSCMPCEEKADGTEHRSELPLCAVHHPCTEESSIAECVSASSSESENPDHTADNERSSRLIFPSHQDKPQECSCQVVATEHFAAYPDRLVEFVLKCAAPKQVCPKCGKGRERVTKPTAEYAEHLGKAWHNHEDDNGRGQMQSGNRSATAAFETLGWTDCGCGAGWTSGVLLDPFAGRGTCAVVAKRLGRSSISIELNPEYCRMIENNLAKEPERLLPGT